MNFEFNIQILDDGGKKMLGGKTVLTLFSIILSSASFAATVPDYVSTTYAHFNGSNYNGTFYDSHVGAASSINLSKSFKYDTGILGVPTDYVISATGVAAPFGGPISSGAPFSYSSAHSEITAGITVSSTVGYQFEVSGLGVDPVLIGAEYVARQISGTFQNGLISYGDGTGIAHWQYSIGVPGTSQIVDYGSSCVDRFCSGSSNQFNYTNTNFFVSPNTIYYIQLVTFASAEYTSAGELGINYSFASAFIDPYISIDPSYTGYTLNFSSGVSNVRTILPSSAVTEPSVWALLLVGFFMMGSAVRRKNAALPTIL